MQIIYKIINFILINALFKIQCKHCTWKIIRIFYNFKLKVSGVWAVLLNFYATGFNKIRGIK
jgi:hypothetical protein